MKHYFNSSFDIGNYVYLKTDPDQRKRLITSISFTYGGHTRYLLASGTVLTWHDEIELSDERDILTTSTN